MVIKWDIRWIENVILVKFALSIIALMEGFFL